MSAPLNRKLGRWVLDAELGSGGMASIYRAHHEALGTPVAVKVLKRSLLDDVVVRERFHREAKTLAVLRHPNILAVLDEGESDGDVYIVLELLEGQTLEAAIRAASPLTAQSVRLMGEQLLSALELCHERGVVHRDVKPSNVMLAMNDGKTRLVLIDFGLARVRGNIASKLTETGVVQGTAHYMSPEQCRGEDVEPASDVYSVGLVLYEMLSGAAPFDGNDAATLMAQHLFVEPTPLRQVAPHVSEGVAHAVHAALAKRPSDRPTARELRALLADAAVGADPLTRAQEAAMFRQRAARLGRDERALGGGADPVDGGAAMDAVIVVWVGDAARAASLRGCLATAGFSCVLAAGDHAEAVIADANADVADVAVVVSAREGIDRVRGLRAAAKSLPVVVVDVRAPDGTTEAIRAGASDMLLEGAPDADLVAKLTRLLRRKART